MNDGKESNKPFSSVQIKRNMLFNIQKNIFVYCFLLKEMTEKDFKKIHMPRAGIEPASSGPQPDVLPLYYRGEYSI